MRRARAAARAQPRSVLHRADCRAPHCRSVRDASSSSVRPGPFTVDVTAAGVLRFSPVITLEGLPAPASLGPYSTYVGVGCDAVMDHVSRLGEVRNGSHGAPPNRARQVHDPRHCRAVSKRDGAEWAVRPARRLPEHAAAAGRSDAVHPRCDSRARRRTRCNIDTPLPTRGATRRALDDGPDAAVSPDAARRDDAAPERRALSAARQRSNAARATASADTPWQRRHAASSRRHGSSHVQGSDADDVRLQRPVSRAVAPDPAGR